MIELTSGSIEFTSGSSAGYSSVPLTAGLPTLSDVTLTVDSTNGGQPPTVDQLEQQQSWVYHSVTVAGSNNTVGVDVAAPGAFDYSAVHVIAPDHANREEVDKLKGELAVLKEALGKLQRQMRTVMVPEGKSGRKSRILDL